MKKISFQCKLHTEEYELKTNLLEYPAACTSENTEPMLLPKRCLPC